MFFQKVQLKINKVLNRGSLVPDMVEKRKLMAEYIVHFKPRYFVETGTFMGDTLAFFEKEFDKLYSIELSEDLAAGAKKRFEKDDHIEVIQGDSEEVLPSVLEKLNGKVMFWLDGHYSSEFYLKGEWIKTAKGNTNTPIVRELELILASGLTSIILVDDARLFTGKDDYPDLRTIKSLVQNSGNPFTVEVSKDIIQIVHPRW